MSSGSGTCEFCNRYIEQGPTRKRHYYYCRAKHRNTEPGRKRACAECVTAKTRCSLDVPSCYRCSKRNQRCSFADSPSQSCNKAPSGTADPALRIANTEVADTTSTPQYITPPSEAPTRSILQISASSINSLLLHTQAQAGIPFATRHSAHSSKRTRCDAVIVHLKSYLTGFCNGTELPPFIHKSQLKVSKISRQHPLARCQALFKAYYDKSQQRATVWALIQTECDRLWLVHESLSLWELLGTWQAVLLFTILRCLDDNPPTPDFDIPFLVATGQIARAVGIRAEDRRIVGIPDGAELPYEKWVFQEAHRRTMCAYRVLNMVFDLSRAVCLPVPGYVILPLPMPDEIWETKDTQTWATLFSFIRWEQSLFGLDDRGRLMKLRWREGEIVTSEYGWPTWAGASGRLGGLIATAAMILW